MVTAAASGEPADWNRMLEQLIIELRTACEQGFTEHEFDLVRKEVLAALERGVRTEATTSAKTLIQGMHTGVNNREPILSAQQHLDLVKELFPTVSAGEVAAVFKKYFDRRTYAYVILMPEKAGKDIPSRDGVLAAARAAWARRIEAATRTESTAQLPAPATTGRAIDLQVEKDFGVTHGWLENGIRVHHRFMDYKKDSVMVSINLAGGGIEETAKNLGVTSVASLAVAEPATSRLSSSDIRDLGAGRNVRVGGGGADDETFAFRIAGSPRDLEYGFQLVYALMTDGRIEETAFKNWRIATLRALERSEKDVGAQAGDALADLTSGGDPRRRTIRRAEVERLGIQEGQAWFDRLCREAPIEVAVVGDIQWDQVRPLLERYLGTLPTRPRSAAHLDKLRSLARGDGPFTRTVEVETQTPVGVAYAGFVGCEGSNINDRRALQVAESILTTRAIKRIREELGLVYSISASNTAAWIYRDSGMFRAGSKCKPENADRVAEEVHRLFREFAESGCTDTELQNARKQLINGLDEAIREPSYWLNLLEHLDLHRRSLEEARTQKKHYETVPAEEIQKAFKRYYVPARIFTVTAVPAKAAAGTAK
jgi:zinc protease